MAHVTYFRFKANPGERDTVIEIFRKRIQEMGPTVKGFQRGILTSNNDDKDEFIAAAMFDSTESYDANSNDPATGKWFEELRSHLTADPEWFNGTLEFLGDA